MGQAGQAGPAGAAGEALLALAVVSAVAALVVAATCDLRCRLVPNRCCAVVAGAGLVARVVTAAMSAVPPAASGAGTMGAARLAASATLGEVPPASVATVSAAASSCAGVMAVLTVLLLSLRLARRAGLSGDMGGGDVKLLASVAAWVGPLWGLACVALSCVVGVVGWTVVAALRALAGRALGRTIPLAPSIALVGCAAVLSCGFGAP